MAPVTDLVTVRSILEAWSTGRISGSDAIELMELEGETELLEAAADNGVHVPVSTPPPTEVPELDQRVQNLLPELL
jgi:hypothetical protein